MDVRSHAGKPRVSWSARGDRDDGEKEEEEKNWSVDCDCAETKRKWRQVEKMGGELAKVSGL